MQYKKLGRTGLKVSELCLGTMQWGWTADEKTANTVMDAFMDAGGNFIDTADVYTRWAEGNPGGVSEEIIGRWMKSKGNRSQVILATKVRGQMGSGPNDQGLSRRHIFDAVDASLRRLQTDYIDLYQTHSFDADTPIDETLGALTDLQKAGKVRYIGASNYFAWQIMESLWVSDVKNLARYDSLQPHYNMVNRAEFERELKPVCEKFQIGVIPYSPLAAGFLTGKYDRNSSIDSKRAQNVTSRYNNDASWKTLDAVRAVAKDLNTNPAAISLAWLLAQPVITSPIIGANSTQQLQESFAVTELKLSSAQIKQLNDASNWQQK